MARALRNSRPCRRPLQDLVGRQLAHHLYSYVLPYIRANSPLTFLLQFRLGTFCKPPRFCRGPRLTFLFPYSTFVGALLAYPIGDRLGRRFGSFFSSPSCFSRAPRALTWALLTPHARYHRLPWTLLHRCRSPDWSYQHCSLRRRSCRKLHFCKPRPRSAAALTRLSLFSLQFAGLGVGGTSCLVPMYQSECAPKHIRGGIVAAYQVRHLKPHLLAEGI